MIRFDIASISVPPEPEGATSLECLDIDSDDYGTKLSFGKTYSGQWKSHDGYGRYYSWEEVLRRFGPVVVTAEETNADGRWDSWGGDGVGP